MDETQAAEAPWTGSPQQVAEHRARLLFAADYQRSVGLMVYWVDRWRKMSADEKAPWIALAETETA